MRVAVVILVLVLGTALAAEDEASAVLNPEQEEQEALLDDMEDAQGRIDLARVLGDLFAGDVGEDTEAGREEEVVADWEGRARTWEIKLPFMKKTKNRSGDAPSGTEEVLSATAQRQYNNLVDTLLRRINAEARKLDPLMITIMPDKKNSGINKKYRYPKNLDIDYAEDSSEDEDTETIDSEHHIEQRAIEEDEEEEEEELVEGRRLYSQDKDGNMVNNLSRRIKLPKKKRNNNKKSGNQNSKKRRNQNKKKINKTGNRNIKNNSKNKRNNKNNNNNKKRTGNRRPKSENDTSLKSRKNNGDLPSVRTSRAEVTGFATLRRDGDIKIITRSNGITDVKTNLVSGPINLKVTRKFGAGKDAITRIGNAASPQMKGSMVITLDAPGKQQKITKFQILRPSIVTTHGSLAKEPNKRRDNNFLENTLPRATPVVTKKLMTVAKEILNAAMA